METVIDFRQVSFCLPVWVIRGHVNTAPPLLLPSPFSLSSPPIFSPFRSPFASPSLPSLPFLNTFPLTFIPSFSVFPSFPFLFPFPPSSFPPSLPPFPFFPSLYPFVSRLSSFPLLFLSFFFTFHLPFVLSFPSPSSLFTIYFLFTLNLPLLPLPSPRFPFSFSPLFSPVFRPLNSYPFLPLLFLRCFSSSFLFP